MAHAFCSWIQSTQESLHATEAATSCDPFNAHIAESCDSFVCSTQEIKQVQYVSAVRQNVYSMPYISASILWTKLFMCEHWCYNQFNFFGPINVHCYAIFLICISWALEQFCMNALTPPLSNFVYLHKSQDRPELRWKKLRLDPLFTKSCLIPPKWSVGGCRFHLFMLSWKLGAVSEDIWSIFPPDNTQKSYNRAAILNSLCIDVELLAFMGWQYTAIDQTHKSHNTPFIIEMYTLLFWMMHCGTQDWCIVGFWLGLLPW